MRQVYESDNLLGEIAFDGIKFEVTKLFWILFLVKSKFGKKLILSKNNRSIWAEYNLPKKVHFYISEKNPWRRLNFEHERYEELKKTHGINYSNSSAIFVLKSISFKK